MGLDNGLSCAMLNVPFQNIVSERFSVGMGYASIAQGNTLYLGTNQGLFMVNLPFCQFLEYRRPTPVEGISGQIWNLTNVDGTVFCCADRGLYSIQGGKATKLQGPDGTWAICELKAHPGYALVTDYLGMLLLKKEGNTYQMLHRVASGLDVSGNIVEDTDGTLWMSHWQKGIYHLQLSKDMKSVQVLQLFNSQNGLLVDGNNLVFYILDRAYISSVDGFYRYDKQKRRLVHDDTLSKVFNTYGSTLKLTEGVNHDLLAQKQDFLAIAHRTGKGYVIDSTSYRGVVKSQQFGLGNACLLNKDITIINGNDGFYLLHNQQKVKDVNYPLFVHRIVSTNDGDSVVYLRSLGGTQETNVMLSHSLNSVKIEFVQPEYLAEDAITYSCFLENYDSRWSNTNLTFKEYTQLGKGDYIFHVKAYNRITGKTQEAQVKFTILPAWYETIWANIVYLILLCIAIYGLVRYLKFRADRELMIERTKRKAEKAQMQNEQLQTELKHKSSELASSTMNSIHHNDILQKLDEEMSLLSESVRREDKKSVVTSKIADIRNSLQTYLNDDEGWNKFEENFNIVYDDFMKKLTEKYTTLKMSDRKLCAYLKMGLSSKEMASLLNMSVRSIETARYRLRKKLNLESGENLTDFIQNFNKNLHGELQQGNHEE